MKGVHIDCACFSCLFGYFAVGTDRRLGPVSATVSRHIYNGTNELTTKEEPNDSGEVDQHILAVQLMIFFQVVWWSPRRLIVVVQRSPRRGASSCPVLYVVEKNDTENGEKVTFECAMKRGKKRFCSSQVLRTLSTLDKQLLRFIATHSS